MSMSGEPSSEKKEILDAPLHALGFEFDEISGHKVAGHLMITPKCCQLFKVLHGGVSALIAEGIASMGAQVATGFQRVAGIQLSINHLKSANMGDLILAEATPVHLGKTIQVWNVHMWKSDPSKSKMKTLVSSSIVTIMCNLRVPEATRDALQNVKKYAKL